MSDYPQTRHEMLRANYHQTGVGVCKGCSAAIEWWKTANGKSIPMDPIQDDNSHASPHWATCPNAKDFKGNQATPAQPARSVFGPSRESQVQTMRQRLDARVVVVIDQFGTAASWDSRIPAEELRHDLISAGNFVRNEILKGDTTV